MNIALIRLKMKSGGFWNCQKINKYHLVNRYDLCTTAM